MACLTEDDLAALAAARLDDATRDAALAHVDDCAACRRIVAQLAAADLPSTADELPRVGRYQLLGAIGAGAMGVVFAAYDPELDRRVALKLLRRERGGDDGLRLEQRLISEARALARLAHPNVIAAYEVGRHEGEVFLAMELVDGQTLAAWLDAEPRSWRDVVRVLVQAGAGLAAAHAADIIHRDFKPDNVLVGADDRARVTDFGLASGAILPPRGDDGGDVAITRTGALIGTPAYMAPEQLEGANATRESDQFAFSVALWEALYGVRPFGGATVAALRVRSAPRERADRRVPVRLRAIVARGLAADPAARWRDLDVMLAALAPFAAPPPSRARATLVAALGAVAIAAVVIAIVVARGGAAPPPRCDAGTGLIAPVWSDARRAEVRAAFVAAAPARGASVFAAVDAAMVRWRDAWAGELDEACAASRIRREQPPEVLERRATCLDLHQRRAAAMIELFAHADADTVERAPGAAQELPAPTTCAHDAGVLPDEPTARAAALDLEQRLAALDAYETLGHRDETLRRLAPLLDDAERRGFDGVRSHVLLLRARDLDLTNQVAEARDDFRTVADLALSLHDDPALADAMIGLAHLAARTGDPEQAETAAVLAEGAVRRLGGDPARTASIAIARCLRDVRLGRDLGAADATCIAARTAVLAAFGDGNVRLSWVDNERGNAAFLDGRWADASAAYEASIAAVRRIYGDGHPSADSTLSNEAQVLMRLGRLDEAERTMRDVLTRMPDAADSLDGLCQILRRRGDLAGAIEAGRRAVALATSSGEHQLQHYALASLAEALLDADRFDEARAALEQARAIPQVSPMPVDAARIELGLARIHRHAGDRAHAAATAEAALARLDAAGAGARGPGVEVRAALVALAP